ncbi:MAG TPA: DinB family protein [Pyrinomonadaceae bacterium]|nr:DinB family protein [Pyrinomonadaceae bacterium]
MQTAAATQPQPTEYAPYYGKYTALVPEGDIINTLESQLNETLSILRGLSEKQGDFVYAPGKWSLKEVVGHILDTERIFGHRAFRFARADATPLPGYEQDDYVRAGNFGSRSLKDLIDELELVRRATISMFRSLDEEAWLRRGVANENEVSVRALAYILAGHETHHMGIIRERYLQ